MVGRQGAGAVHHVRIGDRRGILRLEPPMWQALVEIARRQARDVNDLLAEIDRNRTAPSLTAAARMYVVAFYLPLGDNHAARRHQAAERRPQLRLVQQNP
jgi:predicted DNA-binding ribbon-helix-helix protein